MQHAVKDSASFKNILKNFSATPSVRGLINRPPKAIAVALSGGPDSMALLYLLSQLECGIEIHAITVDHDLRKNSAAEAKQVGAWVASWPSVHHHILKWTGHKPDAAIMEQAREARYNLLTKWCKKNKIDQLWLGHNQTDQAETFLFRLAKGSGLDGLGGMKEVQTYKETDLHLIRPLLNASKPDLLTFCEANKIPFVQDPTNINMHYARSRLRQSLPVLEEEGLSEKRLATTAKRLLRARDALDFYTSRLMQAAMNEEKGSIVFKLESLRRAPEEIRIRAIRQSLMILGVDGYGPRLDRLEDLLVSVFANLQQAKRFTLGGFIFSPDIKRGKFTIARE